MNSLFEFNDAFIASMAGGLTDDDTLGIFSDALDAAGAVMAHTVRKRTGNEDYEVDYRDGFFDVGLTQEQWEAEVGMPGVPPDPAVRGALIAASPPASAVLSRELDADA